MLRGSISLIGAVFALFLAITNPARADEPIKRMVWQQSAAEDQPWLSPTVWIAMPNGGGARKLTAGQDPDISPDGRWIAYVASARDLSSLMVIPSTGGPARLVVTADKNDFAFDWSSDSTKLAFGFSARRLQVASYDVNTGQVGKVAGFLYPTELAAVPDSNLIVVGHDDVESSSNDSVVLVDADQGSARQLVKLGARIASELLAAPARVAVAANHFIGPGRLPGEVLDLAGWLRGSQLRIIDLATRRQQTIGAPGLMDPIGWRPDGRRLDLMRSLCFTNRTTSRCRFKAAVLDTKSGAMINGVGLGSMGAQVTRERRKPKGRRLGRQFTTVRMDSFLPFANSADGSAVLAVRQRGSAHRRDAYRAFSDARYEARVRRGGIYRVPLAGGKPVPLARGWNPDWNL